MPSHQKLPDEHEVKKQILIRGLLKHLFSRKKNKVAFLIYIAHDILWYIV